MTELLVLGYHSVSPTWPAATSVTPEDFEAQLRALVRRGWQAATLVDALTAPTAARTFAVTFDDAHQSVADHAAPILERLGLPATVFVPTDYPDTERLMGWPGYDEWLGTAHEPELRCLSWERLAQFAEQGWEIASHTCSHPRLTACSDEQLADELARSREVCAGRLGRTCHSIAYPYSDVDPRVIRAARAAGYAIGVTLTREFAPQLPLAWPRVGAYHGDGAARLMLRAERRRHPVIDRSLTLAIGSARRAAARRSTTR
jgi:peptidoglycan/xylan/chitin deacetylase (PgdA/CDA1 family)